MTYYSVDEIGRHHRTDDAWVIVDGRVYDITPFLDTHPGGRDIMFEHLGHDVSSVMRSVETHQHTGPAFELLNDYLIGEVQDSKHNEVANGDVISGRTWKEDELIDWSKPLLSQVSKVGDHYDEWVHSPVNRKLRLFESDIIESLSKSPWWLVPLVWIPIIIYTCYLAFTGAPTYLPTLSLAPPVTITGFVWILPLGILLWTFIEYSLHRFVFHLGVPAGSKILTPFHFAIHGQHHKVPFDNMRLVFPPVPAAMIAVVVYAPLAHALPFDLNEMRILLAGGLIGYVCYDMMHYYLHHGSPTPGGYCADLKSYHVAHHYVNPGLGFGISSKLWDVPFRTLLPSSDIPGRKKN